MAQVALRNIVKTFDKTPAVQGIDLDIADREFIVLVGPSGCGKSTTLRMIAGLEEATSGEIYIGDQLVNDVPPKDRDIAMVFQNYALYPHMTVYENMSFGLRLKKFPKPEIKERVEAAARILDITDLLARRPKQLSGGQRQRVALGRAIVREPLVFLMDEPLSNLDAKLRVQTRAELIKLHQRLQTTVIYVTHDQVEAMTMGHRIAVMRDGILQQLDTPQVLYDRPANMFVAGFIGSPSMNFFEGTISASGDELWVEAGTLKLKVPEHRLAQVKAAVGRDVVFGIRPEDIYHPTERKDAPDYQRAKVTIEVVEPLGSEQFVYLRSGNTEFTSRMPSRAQLAAGNNVDVVFDTEKMHVFDKQTEMALA